jgi:PAS domain S-box-containing protein
MFAHTVFNYLQDFDALIVGLLWTFGLIIMLNQRLNWEISEVKTHFETIFNTSPDAAVITRLSDGRFVDCNESYTTISGFSKEDIAGKSSIDINIWKDPADRDMAVHMLQDRGFFENYESLFQKKDGEVITGLMSAKVISLKGVPHIISVTRDISERKKADQLIKSKNEELLKLNAEKDKFYSIIAHDLRSPFNSFLGLTQLMDEQLPQMSMDKLRIIIERLKNSAVNLFSLLENLLSWSSARQGLIPFKQEEVRLKTVTGEGISSSLESAKIKEIEISCHIPDDLTVFADNSMLQTIIRNLVSNAIKFTSKNGKIDVTAQLSDDKGVLIAVKDTGIGMSRSMLDNLFRLDAQINRPGTDGEASTGLGLLLSKEFIEKHGGKLWAVSEEGKGSVFYFTIPGK